MKNEIIYRQIKQEEFDNCLKLIAKFKKNSELNKKFVEWDYSLNPFGKSKIFVAEYRGEFIGIMICNPLKFQNDKKVYNGFRLQDMLTNVSFLRKEIREGRKIPRKEGVGIIPNLLKVTNNYLDKNSEFSIGFPNDKSLPFFENKWVGLSKDPWILHEAPLIEKYLDQNNSNLKFEYNLIKQFDDVHENAWKDNISNKIDIMWTKKHSNWRYILNPRSNYKTFEIKQNTKVVGYIVLKKFEKVNEAPVGHICQLVCPEKFVEDSINFASNYFLDLSAKKLSMWKIADQLPSNLIGFKKVFLKKKFMYKGEKIYDKSSLNLSMSYSDTY